MASLGIASISLSGMMAGMRRVHVSADNIARRPVTNSEKNRVIQQEQPHGGVTTEVVTVPLDEELKSTDEANKFYTASNIDYAEEFIEQNLASMATLASIAVYKKAGQMEEEILNITA